MYFLDLGVGLQESDQVLAVALLLQAGEDHLGAGDELLWVGEPLVEGVLVPNDTGF